ncbi:protein kinase domain-containing protein [Novipirellula rosea]|uniref:Protein kinase n=1 Tax=Novipirellula rosea TaxID=1031540 RepID=A0ABP8NBB8_9BACT
MALKTATADVISSDHNLITAVLTDARLKARLAAMPADEKTVVLSGKETASQLAHPAWKEWDPEGFHAECETPQSAEMDTIALPAATPSPADCMDLGFVPHRGVATIGGGKVCDADYRLVGELGAGGTGIVYQAHQRAVDREVAIKVLRKNLSQDAASRNRFLTEARVIGGLDHPNVIALHEVCIDQDGGLFYSMKRIDGTSWDQQIKEMSLSDNVQTLMRVGDAIRYAHSRGLIHRDIKPENVMLGRFGEVLLADWGLAISHSPKESAEAIDHTIGGTPAYMAPELATGDHRHVSFATDVYLLGATLFQILTGYPPHHGETLLECIQAAAQNKIRPTSVQGELMDIAKIAMATHPSDRYRTVDQFLEALDQQREHDESARLVKRAQGHLKSANASNHYEGFRLADALIMEALEIWPENRRARDLGKELNLEFARAATDQGDLDLAISLYDSAGHGDSEAAARTRRLRDQRNANVEREGRYSTLFTHSPDAGLLIRMSSSRVVEANQTFRDLMGYAEEEIVGKLMTELNLWICPQRRDELIAELERNRRIDNFEGQLRHRDGHPIDVLISGRVTKLAGETMLISSIRDISIRKQTENDLRRSRRRLKDLQALAGLATWSYDAITKQVTWSDEVFRLAGRNPAEGVPTRTEYIEMLHPKDRRKMKDAIGEALVNGASYEIQIRLRDASGNYRHLLVRGQPIFDDDGKTTEIYGVLIPQNSKTS